MIVRQTQIETDTNRCRVQRWRRAKLIKIKFLIKSGQFKTPKITLCKVKSESLHMTCRLSTAVLAFENYKAVMTLW